MRRISILSTVFVLLLMFSCGSNDETTPETRQQYLANAEEKLVKIEDNILALRERADQVLTVDSTQFDAQIDSLAEKVKKAEGLLAKLQQGANGTWQMNRSKLDTLLEEIDRIYADTRDW